MTVSILRPVLFLLLGLVHVAGFASSVDEVLELKEAPSGVVFEIASGNEELLREAIPAITEDIKRLRKRFPDLDVAVVSHGQEQFALTQKNRKQYRKVHEGIQSLVKDANVPVHICETYASWNNIEASDFPDYVDVATTGPAQVNDYRQLGFIVIQYD